MPLLSGMASFLAPHETAFDGAALIGAGGFTTRLNSATQGFERRLTAIDYKIQRQQLHREDIRDLVELTTARMDIYHLVGTLLLAFCMEWYTNGELWELPVWFSDLFLISNYGAVGYLIMCVWLAMYAAVASRSIGTRLLTSYARLSFPTKKEIERIKFPIFHNSKDAINRSRGLDVDGKPLAEDDPNNGKYVKAIDEESEFRQHMDEYAEARVEVPSEDNQQHFRRFRQELPRWLVYDTWARVCMSLGMNQMLQSLSYFSLGIIWAKSPLAAIMSFLAINLLSAIVLWLDVGDLEHSWLDYFAITMLSFLPPCLAILLLLYELVFPRADDNEMRGLAGFLCTVCFWSHAAWLWYLVNLFWTAGSSDSRFQPGSFADVLEWIKHKDENDEVVDESDLGAMAPQGEQLISAVPKSAKLEHESGGAFTRQVTDQQMKERLHETQEINGGREIGVWKTTKKKDGQGEMANPDLAQTNWLPVRMIKYFTIITICWWCMAGFSHGFLIAFHKHNEFRDFTGNNVLPPLSAKISEGGPHGHLFLQFPAPGHLFKVAALHCSESNLWVSSKFDTYAMVQQDADKQTSAASPGALEHVRTGELNTVICGANSHCDALSPPENKTAQWLLAPLDDSDGQAARRVPVPHSWRVVSGAWSDCPEASNATCTSAWLAGWDGKRVVAATMQMDATSKTWKVSTKFEVDPKVGICGDGRKTRECGPKGHLKYDDVSALEMGAGGKTLMVLSGGTVDVWDLPGGAVLQRMHLGDSYTSMCRSGENVYLSREGPDGPVVATMALPSSLKNDPMPHTWAHRSTGTTPAAAKTEQNQAVKAVKAVPVQHASAFLSSQAQPASRASYSKAAIHVAK
jgi:hypothetical protein